MIRQLANIKDTNNIIHELTGIGQTFHSYDLLLSNPTINIDKKKVAEICRRCAKKCVELRQILLEEVKDD